MSAISVKSHSLHLEVGGKSIEVAWHQASPSTGTILLLHEALGSVSYWKNFPQKLAQATGCNVLLYSRPGHGNSEGPLEPRNDEHYLRQIHDVIPTLLQHFSVDCPIVYGHSEGAAIAILYAGAVRKVQALILESPYVIPRRETYEVIAKMAAAYPGSKLQEKLSAYHQEADAVFHSWVNWATALDVDDYPLRRFLANIDCPVLVLQGANDDFGTTDQLQAIQDAVPGLEYESFSDAGHLPHREKTDPLLNRVARFLTGTHRLAGNDQSSAKTNFLEEQR